MSDSQPQTRRTGAILGSIGLVVLAAVVIALGRRGSGPDVPPEPQAPSFAEHWQLAVADLVRFRAAAAESPPDAEQLAGLRDRIRRHFQATREMAGEPHEEDFLTLTSSSLDEILGWLDQAVRAAQDGGGDRVEEATMQVGFILDEMDSLVKLADL